MSLMLSAYILPFVAAADDPCKDAEYSMIYASGDEMPSKDDLEAKSAFIYEMRTFDEDLHDEYLDGSLYLALSDVEKGDLSALKISEIDEEKDTFDVKYLYWSWTDDASDFDDDEDGEYTESLEKDPKDNGENLNATEVFNYLFSRPILPISTKLYLSCLDIDEDADVKVESTIVTIEIKSAKDIKVVIDYSNKGILRSFKVLTDEDKLIYEYAMQVNVGPMDWTIVLGILVGVLTVVAAIGITLYRLREEERE